ncbi:MAG: hypothetical protein AAF192_06715 [Pseudomonadota bacterium]
MIRKTLVTAAALAAVAAPAAANEFAPALRALAEETLRPIAQDPAVVAAIQARNGDLVTDQAEIDRLDKEWRAQVGSADAPLVAAVSGTPAAQTLAAARDASAGLLTEIFAMDAAGLNVAVSDPTSDYWQGDEAKWQETYKAGPEAVHVSEVELDESTQTYQAQVSLPVVDPNSGDAIGAVTFGVNVEMLP